MTPEQRKYIEANTRAALLRRRIEAAATTRMYVCEDPDKFAPGHVVVEDGKMRRMLIGKIVAGFAECLWFSPTAVHADIIHTSMLTLDKDQRWIVHRI